MKKRISFDNFDAIRILEWWLALKQGMGEICCEHCKNLGIRIEKFVGRSDVNRLKRLVKKNPYFINGKRT